ncbi:RsmB/NOP family class I SAM-dependent RNA methyltransferase [Rhodoligotrophos defluvii]|uniref:RsmB/NOP family class I SAM-dependent RNA methyltransferase n=1 Tax=Rhodoligotrophos defluvii TaxID=2561934 RepID=UPI0010C94C2B|nr:RsmB/NOP family class I SAM-dependent RNA methyltransferase [Rhodoligotrophos defluvii]
MTPGARIQAAIEVIAEIEDRHRPAAEALKDWGRMHRFAGAGDRAAIGNLVFDVLRRRNSLAARMEDGRPRTLVLAAAADLLGLDANGLAGSVDVPHGPGPLGEAEKAGLARKLDGTAAPWIAGDYPEWLHPAFTRVFGDRAAEEGAALAVRAPIDLRVNALRSSREKVARALARFSPQETPLSPVGLRIAPPQGLGRSPNVESDPAHERGLFEVQDEGSQLAALLADTRPGMQVADICAGAGGKTLALAAAMGNKGQIYAHDADATRLKPIFARLTRAAARNVQVIGAHEPERLDAHAGKLDRVVVDAPCTGTGAWRRHPDAKWRLKPQALERRLEEQRLVLDRASTLVKPGGRLVYITCSVLAEENGDQIAGFLARHPGFQALPWAEVWRASLGVDVPASAGADSHGLLLTPARHGTDGFYVCIMERGE